jgi:hypothetical protein
VSEASEPYDDVGVPLTPHVFARLVERLFEGQTERRLAIQ